MENKNKKLAIAIAKRLSLMVGLFLLGFSLRWMFNNTTVNKSGRYFVVKVKYISDADSIKLADKKHWAKVVYQMDSTYSECKTNVSEKDHKQIKDAILKKYEISFNEYQDIIFKYKKSIIEKDIKALKQKIKNGDEVDIMFIEHEIQMLNFDLSALEDNWLYTKKYR